MFNQNTVISLVAILGIGTRATHATIRDGNDGNCVGVKSCRPRCVSFMLDRHEKCDAVSGIFANISQLNPWDIQRFRTSNCEASNTCVNDKCGTSLQGDLTIHIAEHGYIGETFSTKVNLPADQDSFTFCSIYPCTKDECALPEQMGLAVQFSIFEGQVDLNDIVDPLLVLELYLTATFVGQVLQENTMNHYGPLHVEWMDDPTNCREQMFSEYAPISPDVDPVVTATSFELNPLLYCAGDEYSPAPLPQSRLATLYPSLTPTLSLVPSPAVALSSAPSNTPTIRQTVSPTFSSVGVKQMEALRLFYNATQMDSSYSSAKQNWFTVPDYCNFTGIICDVNGYIVVIDLIDRGLAGSLPKTWDHLNRLTKLKVAGNEIAGSIPNNIYELDKLTTIELSGNSFTGEIPRELRRLKNLRRLLLQDNNLNGTIHKDLCEMKYMTAFHIAGNVDMTGEIPSCFGELPLEIFRVDNVGLVGEVPSSLCGVRLMNGLTPNQFGCDALACPAGFYGTLTRKIDNQTNCIACSVPSNVIGSSTCVVVQGNQVIAQNGTRTLSPTAISASPSALSASPGPISFSPSASPSIKRMDSESPSLSPLFYFVETRSPSFADTNAPLSLPAAVTNSPTLTTTVVSNAPSSAPSAHTETIRLSLIFVGVTLELLDTESFTNSIKLYFTSNFTIIETVRVLSQSVQEYTRGGVAIVSHRTLESEALYVEVEIEGRTTDQETLADAVENCLVDFEEFTICIGLTKQVDTKLPVVPLRPIEAPAGKRYQWGFLGAAVGLSVVAVGSIYMMRNRQQRSTQPELRIPDHVVDAALFEESDDFPDDSSEESRSGWSSTTSQRQDDEDSMSDEWSNIDVFTATKPETGNHLDEML